MKRALVLSAESLRTREQWINFPELIQTKVFLGAKNTIWFVYPSRYLISIALDPQHEGAISSPLNASIKEIVERWQIKFTREEYHKRFSGTIEQIEKLLLGSKLLDARSSSILSRIEREIRTLTQEMLSIILTHKFEENVRICRLEQIKSIYNQEGSWIVSDFEYWKEAPVFWKGVFAKFPEKVPREWTYLVSIDNIDSMFPRQAESLLTYEEMLDMNQIIGLEINGFILAAQEQKIPICILDTYRSEKIILKANPFADRYGVKLIFSVDARSTVSEKDMSANEIIVQVGNKTINLPGPNIKLPQKDRMIVEIGKKDYLGGIVDFGTFRLYEEFRETDLQPSSKTALVDEALRSQKEGVLCFSGENGQDTLRVPFVLYNESILVFPSIIHYSKIENALHQQVHFFVFHGNLRIKLRGRLELEGANLDNDWKVYLEVEKDDIKRLSEQYNLGEKLSYYWKRMVIRLMEVTVVD